MTDGADTTSNASNAAQALRAVNQVAMPQTIAVCGSGILGSQIAYQAALHGHTVRLYNPTQAGLERGQRKLRALPAQVAADLGLHSDAAQAALARVQGTTVLAEAVQGSDMVIEAIPEQLQLKLDFFAEASAYAQPSAILATNTSTFLPSQLVQAVSQPQRFLALHFAARLWRNNMAEIMGTEATSPASIQRVAEFARGIGMVPIVLHKEQAGYIINSLLLPLLDAALDLAVRGVAEPHDIDRTWMLGSRAPAGPFAMLDTVGLATAYNIFSSRGAAGDARAQAAAEFLNQYIQAGHTGAAAGQGFYSYPAPAFLSPDFLKEG